MSLKKAGVGPGVPAAQVLDERDAEITANLGEVLDDGDVNTLALWRLAHLMDSADYELMCERVGVIHCVSIKGVSLRLFGGVCSDIGGPEVLIAGGLGLATVYDP
jgi:hypothetical protein